jgi:alkanesulfonate monooxygenase SsuD/methylene tetrahydromethanopterin reductase-like flavin-dependent oxidoreductase (luciferase family)
LTVRTAPPYRPAHDGGERSDRSIDELVPAGALGVDGVCVDEHHANAYGNMRSPGLIGSGLARRTTRGKIAAELAHAVLGCLG